MGISLPTATELGEMFVEKIAVECEGLGKRLPDECTPDEMLQELASKLQMDGYYDEYMDVLELMEDPTVGLYSERLFALMDHYARQYAERVL